MRRISLCLLLLPAVLLNCRQQENSGKGRSVGSAGPQQASVRQDAENHDTVYHRFPSSREMLNYIRVRDFAFKPGLTNPVGNTIHYHSSFSRTLNLGGYLTDMAYLSHFQQSRKTREYFNTVVELSNELRINIPGKQKLIDRASSDLRHIDSLVGIGRDYEEKVLDYLKETGQEKTLAILMTGSYIEGLYLAVHLVGDYRQGDPAVEKIAEQKYAFDHLESFVRRHVREPGDSPALFYLKKLNVVFGKLEVRKESTRVRRDSARHMVIEGGDRLVISEKDFVELRNRLDDIRHHMTAKNNKEGYVEED